MAPVSLKITGRILRTPVFMILILLWIILVISLASSPQPLSLSPNLISGNGNVPQYQTSTITVLNGTNATVYSQTFNDYGKAETGWNVTYSISVFSGQMEVISSLQYAGITNGTGMVIYNVTGLQRDHLYEVTETVSYHGDEWANHTTPISTFTTHGVFSVSIVSGPVSITPVLSETSSSYFAIHVWKIPQNREENYTVKYGKTSGDNYIQAINWAQKGNFPDRLTNFTMTIQANIQTNFKYAGEPYYYSIGVISQNGSLAGASIFGSRVSTQAKMEDSAFLTFASLSIFLIIFSFYVCEYFSNPSKRVRKRGKVWRFFFGGTDLHYHQEISGRYGETLLTSVLISSPFVLITALTTYIFTTRIYGISPAIGVLISYSVASFMTVLFVSSLTVSAMRSRFRKFFVQISTKNDPFDPQVKINKNFFYAYFPSYLLTYFYMSLLTNFGWLSLFTSSSEIIDKVTVILYSINPLTYLWLLGVYLSKDIAVTGTSTFNPLASGLSPFSIFLIGSAWIILILVIPGVIFIKRERKAASNA